MVEGKVNQGGTTWKLQFLDLWTNIAPDQIRQTKQSVRTQSNVSPYIWSA